jgi:hypothetical protein
MARHITEYFLYRQRYILGYSLISLAVVALLGLAWWFLPGGLSAAEMSAVVTTNSLTFSIQNFNPSTIINLPYHVFQYLSFTVFGVSTLSIKLPSLILGLLSAVGILLLLRTWFRRNVAIITTIIAITSSQFIFLSQHGTPAIVYIFWPIWLLVAAIKISRLSRFSFLWKIALFAIVALSLYTPFTIYILLALLSAIILHPHLRFLIKRVSKVRLALASVCALVIVSPLAYGIWLEPRIGLQLLGIPSEMPDLSANALQLTRTYVDFLSPFSSTILAPVYSLGTLLLIALGFIRLFTTKYTARGYVITAWIVLLIPALLVNPSIASITFVPVIIIIAMGVSMLLTNWYRLFPRNPYARLAGLLPLAVLIGGIVLSNVDRYMQNYLYNPQLATQFSSDLDLINTQLSDPARGATAIITSDSEVAFYQAVAKDKKDTSVVAITIAPPLHQTAIITHNAMRDRVAGDPWRIVANNKKEDADRFYIYKTNSQ